MDSARRQRDRAYRHLFKGSVLVTTLLEQDKERFSSRADAVRFGQHLLDAGHIQSIVGSKDFDDSVHLYRWTDESIVEEAKKLVSSSTNHIPKKRLTELLNFQRENGDAQTAPAAKQAKRNRARSTSPGQCTSGSESRTRSQNRIRSVQTTRPVTSGIADKSKPVSRDPGIVAKRCRSFDSNSGGVKDSVKNKSTGRRSSSVPNPASGSSAERKVVAKKDSAIGVQRTVGQSFKVDLNRRSTGKTTTTTATTATTQAKVATTAAKTATTGANTATTAANTATTAANTATTAANTATTAANTATTAANTATTGANTAAQDNKPRKSSDKTNDKAIPSSAKSTDDDFVPQKSPQHIKIELVGEKPVRNPQHTSIDFISFVDFQMTPPVSPEQNNEFCRRGTPSEDRTSKNDSRASQSQDDRKSADVDVDALSTCRYDGVEMPALDLENLDFDSLRPSTKKMARDSLAVMQKSMDALSEQSHGYSDNEKVLLEQMKAMRSEHQKVIDFYERKIDSLMNSINYIKDTIRSSNWEKGRAAQESAPSGGSKPDGEKTDDQKQKSNQQEKTKTSELAQHNSTSKETSTPATPQTSSGGATVPAPPPPPPPPPPLLPSQISKVLRPTKPAIKPRVKMRPLFWNRIILDNKDQDEPNFWHSATEPNFDVSEFEKLFGRKAESRAKEKASLHESLNPSKGLVKVQAAKILDEKRSKAVGIKMRSLHCTLEDIKHALYSLDFSKVDVDSLQSLADMRATEEELNKIRQHLKEHPNVSLDKPEEFLWELSKLSYFPERAKCFALKKRFSETLFNIDQQLCTVENACAELTKSEGVRTVLELILAFGNYMNGGTQRGQADGFDLSILVKLKDVKAMDNSTTLLHFIVRQHCKEYEDNIGKKAAQFPLPDQSLMTSAAATSFVDLGNELRQLKQELSEYSKKAEEIYRNTDSSIQQPFKEQMDDFFDSAEHMLEAQQAKVDETNKTFQDLLKYLLFTNNDEVTPNSFFSMWAAFLDHYKRCWKEEQRRLAREMFEKVEEKRKERMRMVKRRRSMPLPDDHNINKTGANSSSSSNNNNNINLKQKFNAIRRKSEMSARLFRSQSVHNMNDVREEDWKDSRTTKSYGDYPTPGSTPSPSALCSPEPPKLRHNASSPGLAPERDQDHVFNHEQDDRRPDKADETKSPDRSRLTSTFQLNLKKELKPTITVTNPITNSVEHVTLRRDLNGDRPEEAVSAQARLRERWNRMSSEGQSPNCDEKTRNGATSKPGRFDREKPLTRPKSSANMDDLKRLSALKSPKGPMKIDYKTDFVPGKLEPSKMFPFQSTPLSHSRHLRSAENLSTIGDESTAKSASRVPASSSHNSPIRCGSVERLATNLNPNSLASRSHFERSPCDVASSVNSHIENWRKLSRAGTQSNSSAR